MNTGLSRFEAIVRRLPAPAPPAVGAEPKVLHPFEFRNIHPDLPDKVRKLFDDGHAEDAVFYAFKFIEKEVKAISKIRGKTGEKLMGAAFGADPPPITLNARATDSDLDEQRGYQFLFTGAVAAIRNPRGHEVDIVDAPDDALDYLAFASLLLRRLDAAGLR